MMANLSASFPPLLLQTDIPQVKQELNKNKTQTAVTNICLNCIPFMNLTFRMLQHTSSEVIIIQLQINLNSKIQLYGLGTNEIEGVSVDP